MDGVGETQPISTCDRIKNPSAGQLGTIVVTEYRVGKQKRRRGRMVRGLRREVDLERGWW